MSRSKAPGYAGLAILALLLGSAFLGADIEMLDSINIVAPVWVALALAYLLFRLSMDWRRGRRASGTLSALLAAGYVIFALLIFRPLWGAADTIAATGERLRLVSFNINKDNPDQREVARWIDAQLPDFVVLLEARDRPGSAARLLKARYPYQYDCRGDGQCSTLILSRTPALDVTHHARGDAENRKSISALTARFDRGGETIAITATHMPRPWPMGRQTSRLRELAAIAARPAGNQIVVGDFNNVPWTFAMNRLAVDMDIRLLSRVVATWPTDGPGAILPIDNIYGRGCLRLADLSRGPEIWSDHHPLVMTAEIGDAVRNPAFLALAAVVNPRDPPTADALVAQLGPDFCGWQTLVGYAERHRVMPLFANRLRALDWMDGTTAQIDADLQATLGKTVHEAAFAELASLAELKRISERFADHGVMPILLKGLALSQLCFGKIGWRTNHDIDILIAPAELATCDRLLGEMDYVRVEPHLALDATQTEHWRRSHKDWVYVHRSRRTIVEVHYRLFDNEPLCAEVDLDQVEALDLFGQHRVLSLTGDALLTYLALHGLLHGWSRLKWLIDYELIRAAAAPIADQSVATRVADRLGDALFSTPSAAPHGRGFGRTAMLVRSSLTAMAGAGACELEQTKFGTTIKNMSHYLISVRPAYWIAELRYDLSDSSRDDSSAAGRSGFVDRVANWFRRKVGFDSGSGD